MNLVMLPPRFNIAFMMIAASVEFEYGTGELSVGLQQSQKIKVCHLVPYSIFWPEITLCLVL